MYRDFTEQSHSILSHIHNVSILFIKLSTKLSKNKLTISFEKPKLFNIQEKIKEVRDKLNKSSRSKFGSKNLFTLEEARVIKLRLVKKLKVEKLKKKWERRKKSRLKKKLMRPLSLRTVLRHSIKILSGLKNKTNKIIKSKFIGIKNQALSASNPILENEVKHFLPDKVKKNIFFQLDSKKNTFIKTVPGLKLKSGYIKQILDSQIVISLPTFLPIKTFSKKNILSINTLNSENKVKLLNLKKSRLLGKFSSLVRKQEIKDLFFSKLLTHLLNSGKKSQALKILTQSLSFIKLHLKKYKKDLFKKLASFEKKLLYSKFLIRFQKLLKKRKKLILKNKLDASKKSPLFLARISGILLKKWFLVKIHNLALLKLQKRVKQRCNLSILSIILRSFFRINVSRF